MQNARMNEFPLLNETDGIPLFYPHVPREAIAAVTETLSGRWIGQGPKVELFESQMKQMFLAGGECIAVGSGTDALHLAYLLAGVQSGDEVISTIFTCTATNIPLLYIGAKPVFCDIDPATMNIDENEVEKKITKKTKAIVCVDYGGVPCNYQELRRIADKHGLKLISDAAHSMGSTYQGRYAAQYADFTIFSFQAIKTITTGDGGLLAMKDASLLSKAKRLRWFGINREDKQKGIWENDIVEVGYKYQMTDISAAMGLAALKEIDQILNHRNTLFRKYEECLTSNRIQIIGKSETEVYFNSSWLITVVVDEDRYGLMKTLRSRNIESAQSHYRNDRYSIFGGRQSIFPQMDRLEDRYLVLPLHTRMNISHVERICEVINKGW